MSMEENWKLWDLFQLIPRLFIVIACLWVFGTNLSDSLTINIIMVVLTIWAFYPGVKFVYYSFKLGWKKNKK